jgi:DtxR family Mn-dependent transcriptional regulator
VAYELADDDIDLLQSRVAERLDVPFGTISEMIRRLIEVSLVHLDGRTVSLTPAGSEQGLAVLPRHRLAERFLTDVLEMKSGEAHREPGRVVAPPAVQAFVGNLIETGSGPIRCSRGAGASGS